jgi:hypothetical protein
VWVGTLGALMHSLPPMDKLPEHVAIYVLLGIGFVLSLIACIGLVIVLCFLTEKWWTWIKRAVYKRTRNRIWDLEYDVQEANRLAKVEEYKAEAKLAELKNATWEV